MQRKQPPAADAQPGLSPTPSRWRRGGGGGRWGWRGVAVRLIPLAIVVAVGLLWHPPLYIASPGPATNIAGDMSITGVTFTPPVGQYLLVDVVAEQHCALVDVVDSLRPHREVYTTAQVGSMTTEFDTFNESRVLAATAAARSDGITVGLTGSGAEVTGAVAGSPAASVLSAGDLVVSVDGAPVRTEFDLQSAVAAKPVGSHFVLGVKRSGRTITLNITSTHTNLGDGESVGTGAELLTKNLEIASPFQITFKNRAIGGPSAGLVYALAVADALGSDHLAAGHTIAATGTIDIDGVVGDVGSVDLKALGAKAAGASLVIVPSDEVSQATGIIPQVQGVTSLRQALQIVQADG